MLSSNFALMKKTQSDASKYIFMSSFLLPEGMLDYFDIVRIDEESTPKEEVYTGGILHIYLDELDMTFWSARLFRKIEA